MQSTDFFKSQPIQALSMLVLHKFHQNKLISKLNFLISPHWGTVHDKTWEQDGPKMQLNGPQGQMKFHIFLFPGFQIAGRTEIVPGRSAETQGSLLRAIFGCYLIIIHKDIQSCPHPASLCPGFKVLLHDALSGYQKEYHLIRGKYIYIK